MPSKPVVAGSNPAGRAKNAMADFIKEIGHITFLTSDK
jgi:hypothetical protein